MVLGFCLGGMADSDATDETENRGESRFVGKER